MQYDKADQQNCPRRVVFYGRVSTELEAQISALKNQMNWYLELAEHHPNWTVVGQYADEGISGTGMKTRPSFMKMLRDARKKKFDLIVTREVSRFARNTVDTLVTTRELKQYGVEVYFVNDDIWTMRGDGEVRLTIMASLAQDESRKMSERTKAGIQTSQKKGTYVAGPTPFGYKRDKKAHTLVVQESQAETVRKIFAWYADGINGTEIAQTLTQEGAPNKSGMPQWSARQVLSITKNTIYKGYLTYNKSHIDDFLSHKSIKNSEQDYILVKGSFEPIISEELWDKCQRRRHAWQSYKDGNITQAYLYGKSEHADKWACRMFCGCGARMRAFRAEKGIVRYICYQRSLRNVAPKCSAPNVQAWKLELMAREIYKYVWQDHRQDILEEYQQEQENGAANSEKVEEALSWQESFQNDEISREFLDRFVPKIFSIDGQKFIWELNLFQESCTVQCNVRGTYNYHSISAEKIMPGKTKAKKGDGAVNRILEDAISTRFWVHTYDDDPISRLLLKLPASNLQVASKRCNGFQ